VCPEAGITRRESGAIPVRFVLGLAVIALGVIFLGDNLGLFAARDLLRSFWPLAFVAVGVSMLTQRHGRGSSRFWGLVWVVAGVWIYCHQRGWIEVEFWDVFVPALLVVVGGSLVWRSLAGPRPRRPGVAEESDASLHSFAVMSGFELRSTSQAFRGADLGAVMGGVTLDLTQAKIAAEEAVIDVFAWWGGIEIRVPQDWTVVSRVTPLMAGYEDKTRPSSATPTHRLVIRGIVVMGGVEVKN
jgi:predicted membrane protein